MKTRFLVLALIAFASTDAHADPGARCAGRLEQALKWVNDARLARLEPIDPAFTGLSPHEAPEVNATRALGLSGIESPFVEPAVARRVDLRPEDSVAAYRLAAKYGVADWRSNSSLDLLERVYQKLKSGTEDPLKKARTMSAFCRELDPLISHLPEEVLRENRYMMADAVLTLEEWQPQDYVPAGNEPFGPDSGRAKFIHLEDYPEYVESFVEKKAPYNEIAEGGLLSVRQMRDAASHNLWPIGLLPHDILHAQYALGHPRAMAMYFKSARSKSNLRFAMIASMYEGVDTVQFQHEKRLAFYMAQVMELDLEQAMVYLATVDEAELVRIAKASRSWGPGNVTGGVDDFAAKMSHWRPKTKDSYPVAGRHGAGLDADVDAAIAAFTLYGNDSKKALNYGYSSKIHH